MAMDMFRKARIVLLAALAAWSLVLVPPLRAETTEADRELMKKVWARIVARYEPVEGYHWPPEWVIEDKPTINANARLVRREIDGQVRQVPLVTVYQGLLDEVIQGHEDRLAALLGHELAHIALRHCETGPERTPLATLSISREDEANADLLGIEKALQAGYSFAGLRSFYLKMLEVGSRESSFEGLLSTHPVDLERLAAIDKQHERLWRSMSAFENGVYFLLLEQYPYAERCFRQVTREFPSCYEGWANLGYAQLMMYCDALEPEDLRFFDLGQLVVGGFYRRSEHLDSQIPRGIDEELWFDAVGALREALRLKPDLVLVKANLAVAYLVRPAGRDVGTATRYFEEVAQALRDPKVRESLDPLVRTSLLLNSGVALMAQGKQADCEALFKRVEDALVEIESPRGGAAQRSALSVALSYNRALLRAGSENPQERRSAAEQLEQYLRRASPAQAWWNLAYDRYARLCREQQLEPLSAEVLRQRTVPTWRLVTELELPDGGFVAVGEKVADVLQRLGSSLELTVVPRTNMKRLVLGRGGCEVLVSESVLAICLSGPEAVPVKIREAGLATGGNEVRVGMSVAELDALLGDLYDKRELTRPGVHYRYYRELGLAIKVSGGKVEEIVIAQLPERQQIR
jgi:hypothetical protein